MEWNHSNTLALAKTGCTQCNGLGMRTARGKEVPCACAMRAVFRACFDRFKSCIAAARRIANVNPEFVSRGRDTRVMYGRKNEEYTADFLLIARRTLDPVEEKLFKFHFLLGGDWKLCCGKLGMERGNFFHAVYRIEEKLGRVFATLEPYALYPLDEYFGTIVTRERVTAFVVPDEEKHVLRPPMSDPAFPEAA